MVELIKQHERQCSTTSDREETQSQIQHLYLDSPAAPWIYWRPVFWKEKKILKLPGHHNWQYARALQDYCFEAQTILSQWWNYERGGADVVAKYFNVMYETTEEVYMIRDKLGWQFIPLQDHLNGSFYLSYRYWEIHRSPTFPLLLCSGWTWTFNSSPCLKFCPLYLNK